MESISISSGLALVFGALHALEPGHGKTALLTYIASGKRTWKEGAVISITSAITHSLAVFFIAFLSHFIVHHTTTDAKVAHIGNILSGISGALICSLGLWIIFKSKKGEAKVETCCSCSSHGHQKKKLNKGRFFTSGLLGIATGIIPCPSVVVAYLSGLSTGNSLLGMQSVILFALGMCISLMSVITICSFGGEKLVKKLGKSKVSMNWGLIQGVIFITIGLGTAFYH